MDAYLLLLLKLAVSVVTSLVVLQVLARPLSAVLERLTRFIAMQQMTGRAQ